MRRHSGDGMQQTHSNIPSAARSRKPSGASEPHSHNDAAHPMNVKQASRHIVAISQKRGGERVCGGYSGRIMESFCNPRPNSNTVNTDAPDTTREQREGHGTVPDDAPSPSPMEGSEPSSILTTKLSASRALCGHCASGGSVPYPTTSRGGSHEDDDDNADVDVEEDEGDECVGLVLTAAPCASAAGILPEFSREREA